jgi:hypothetical protein
MTSTATFKRCFQILGSRRDERVAFENRKPIGVFIGGFGAVTILIHFLTNGGYGYFV